jgi:molecular chaperone HscB
MLTSPEGKDDKDEIKQRLFCTNDECKKIQPLPKATDYFDLLSFQQGKTHFHSSTAQASLEASYKNLQKLLHPDLFSNKSLVEQEHSAANSAFVNAAYQCLRSDIDRANYILTTYHGIDVLSECGGSHHDASINMQIFDIREEIDELDYSDEQTVQAMLDGLRASREDIEVALDGAIRDQNVESMTREAIKLRYWGKMIEEIGDRQQQKD